MLRRARRARWRRQAGAAGLPIAYHWGGTDAVKVHLAVKSDWSLKPVYDVIAMLRGRRYPDQWIVRGNHHDGWVFGACDPLSGQVALMGEAKALGALYRQGWRPERTIVYASWDGEEPGLLGSTEWAETHADELKRKAVLYINTDNNGRGFLRAGGSHALQHFVNQVAADVTDPADRRVRRRERGRAGDPRRRLYAATTERRPERASRRRRPAATCRSARSARARTTAPSSSISGIASLNVGFGGEDEAAASITRSTTLSITSPISTIPACDYGAALVEGRRAGWCCAPPTLRACRRAIAISPTTVVALPRPR